ncbi:hypothetical protein QZM52_12195 [Burkholderia metallica]|uniref:Uncharacterized protein n=1 Tax=Burkholderia metallica TaxID=488729 RepID=A0ABT8PAF7_9BURK|nr:hypothetical protein [Burkholderia metallica]MDN7932041.1 hypothetical protein [Burkholderia metallica]
MKMLAIVGWLTLFPAFTGVYAARLWYLSSKLHVKPTWEKYAGFEPGVSSASTSGWIAGIIDANRESAELNRRAALWTATSVGLSAVVTVIGTGLPLIIGQ